MKKIIIKFEFWAVVISGFSLLFSIYTFNGQRKLNHQHIIPEMKCKLEYPLMVQNKQATRNKRNPELTLYNNGSIKVVALTVDSLLYTYEKSDKKIATYGKLRTMPFDHLIFKKELAPSLSVSKYLVGTGNENSIGIYIFDLTYHRETDMKRYKTKEIFFIENNKVYSHKEFINNQYYMDIISCLNTTDLDDKTYPRFSLQAVDDDTWVLEADKEYKIKLNPDGSARLKCDLKSKK